MQSEGGAAGAVHGALQAGALTTTFTASQGLLLMIPNMYKIAGELTAFCMHVAARTVATHALSIFGDHSDVMACRQTGFAMLCSGSVQEAQDFAVIATRHAWRARVPFLHFFDGFRTSHEVAKIEELADDDLRAMMDDGADRRAPDARADAGPARAARHGAEPRRLLPGARGLQPVLRRLPGHRRRRPWTSSPSRTGRALPAVRLRRPSRGRARDRDDGLRRGDGARSGRLPGREGREGRRAQGPPVPAVLHRALRRGAAEDRQGASRCWTAPRSRAPSASRSTMDVVTAAREARDAGELAVCAGPVVVGGRYGLSSKEFTPAMVKAVFDELKKPTSPRTTSRRHQRRRDAPLAADYDADFDIEPDDVSRAVFFGLGADGTVGANKNSIKIIGEETTNYAQGYFVYDSKKSGAMTISHLRFGPEPIRSRYLIQQRQLRRLPPVRVPRQDRRARRSRAGRGLPAQRPFAADEVWDHLPREVQEQIIEKKLKFYVIDAYAVAKETGMGGRINTIMQTCFFAISGVLPRDEAIEEIKKAIKKTYGSKGEEVVAEELRRRRPDAGQPARGHGPGHGHGQAPAARRSSPTRRPSSSRGSRP